MPRDIPVGNGNILVAFDHNYILREFYFPHVGQENHTKGEPFRFGVWVNGRFSWIPDGWQISMNYLDDTLVTNVELVSTQLNIRIIANDLVDFRENIYVKKLTVENLANEPQEARIFLCHDFHIYGNDIGDTAVFRPETNGLLHYKGERYFLINACANNKCGIDQFATGNKKQGYFLHKYTPQGELASSWHPWLKDNELQLPIQEDETALVIWALWKHYDIFRDIEFIRPLYKPLIKNAADFMMRYRDKKTKLPLPGYDLWEERYGVHTFTVGAVYGGLLAAARFTKAFGETDVSSKYSGAASEIRKAMDEYLYLQKENRFARMINFRKDGEVEADNVLDTSLCGIFMFGAYDVNDEKVTNTMRQVYEKLWLKTEVGGMARYENDPYYRVSDKVPGNPWFVTTLWLAQYYIALAKTKAELDKAINIMEWVARHALPSGVLAEQVNPYTNEPVSVSPLTWSHATFIIVVHEYLQKLLEIEKCEMCGQSKYSKKKR